VVTTSPTTRVQAPSAPGVYELEILLVVEDTCVIGHPTSVPVHVAPKRGSADPRAADDVLVESEQEQSESVGPSEAEPTAARLHWIREHLRMEPVQRADSPVSQDSLVAVAIECGASFEGSDASDVQLTYHWKKDGDYVAWDVRRQVVSGLRPGRQIRVLTVERPHDASMEIEVAAVVSGEGYVRMFRSG
jgi:hypothetical protein